MRATPALSRRTLLSGLAAGVFAANTAPLMAADRLPPVDQYRLDSHFKPALDMLTKDPLRAFGRSIRLTLPNDAQYAALQNRGYGPTLSGSQAELFNTRLYVVLNRYARLNNQLPALHPFTDSLLDINEGIYPVAPSKDYRDISRYLDIPQDSTARYVRNAVRTQIVPALYADLEKSVQGKDWIRAIMGLAALQDAFQMAGFPATPRPVFKADSSSDPLAQAVAEFSPDDNTLAGVRPADATLKACGLQAAAYDATVSTLLQDIARQGYDRMVKNIVANSKSGPDDKRFYAAWQGLHLTQWALGNLLMMHTRAQAKLVADAVDPTLVLTQPASVLLTAYNDVANKTLGTPDCGMYKSHLWLLGSSALFDESRRLYDGGLAGKVGAVKPMRASLQAQPYCADIVGKPKPF